MDLILFSDRLFGILKTSLDSRLLVDLPKMALCELAPKTMVGSFADLETFDAIDTLVDLRNLIDSDSAIQDIPRHNRLIKPRLCTAFHFSSEILTAPKLELH